MFLPVSLACPGAFFLWPCHQINPWFFLPRSVISCLSTHSFPVFSLHLYTDSIFLSQGFPSLSGTSKLPDPAVKDKKMVWSSQHGFMKGKSRMTNLITFYNKITDSVDKRRAVGGVYLNFSKAFDTVFCNILIDKLLNRQINGQWGELKTSWTTRLEALWSTSWSQAWG